MVRRALQDATRWVAPRLSRVALPGFRLTPSIVHKHTDCQVCHFTGDNPATILSFSLLTGETVVSLGTSDTVLLSTTDYAPTPDAHLFSYPANRKGGKVSYMAMLCYKNGSLPREHVRDKYAGGSWETFDKVSFAADVGDLYISLTCHCW